MFVLGSSSFEDENVLVKEKMQPDIIVITA